MLHAIRRRGQFEQQFESWPSFRQIGRRRKKIIGQGWGVVVGRIDQAKAPVR